MFRSDCQIAYWHDLRAVRLQVGVAYFMLTGLLDYFSYFQDTNSATDIR